MLDYDSMCSETDFTQEVADPRPPLRSAWPQNICFFTPRLIKKTSTQCCLKKVGQCVFNAKTCWQPFPIARCMGGYAILSYHAPSFTSSLVASLAWIRVHWVSNFNSSHLTHKLKSLGTLSNKKNDIIWEFFPTWGGGSSQIPKLL